MITLVFFYFFSFEHGMNFYNIYGNDGDHFI